MLALTLSLVSFTVTNAQNPAVGYMLMNTGPLRVTGNYTIGYLAVDTNSSACKRIKMFKFPALMTGLATSLTLNVLPSAVQGICDTAFSLFNFNSGTQIGSTVVGAFSSTGSAGVASWFEISNTVNVTGADWQLVSGSLYYMTIQTFSYNSIGAPCNMRIPYGVSTISPPSYALVIEQGPIGFPCGAAPWATVAALYGGYIHMSIGGLPMPMRATFTHGQIKTPYSDLISGSDTPSASASSTPSPSASSAPSASPTSSASPTPSPSVTGSEKASSSPMLTNLITISNTPVDTALAIAASSNSNVPTASIVGGVMGSIAILALVLSIAAFKVSRSLREQFVKYTLFKEARSPVSRDSVITLNPVGSVTNY